MTVSPFDRLGRDAGMVGPVVVVAERSGLALTRIRSVLRRHRVATVEFQDVVRARGYLAARPSPLLVAVPGTPSWAATAVAALRATSNAPIVVSGMTTSTDELAELFELGATITVDAGAREAEISLRIRALYAVVKSEPRSSSRWLESGDLRVDLFSKTCTIGGETVRLSRNEYRLLVYLMSRPQQTIKAADIVNQVWQWSHGDGLNTLRIHIGRLRRKLDDSAREPKYIVSMRGAGYRFKDPVVEIGDDVMAEGLGEVILNARLEGIYSLLEAMRSATSLDALGMLATETPVASSHCDGASLFRYEGDQRRRSLLVASDGMSSEWQKKMRRGHKLSGDFVGGQVAVEESVVQVADLARAAKRFPVSAAMMSVDQFRSCLVVPLRVNGEIWGDIGFLKREPRAFSESQATFLHSIAGVLELKIAALSDS